MTLENRFKWKEIENKQILFLDISNTNEKELLSLMYRITDYSFDPKRKEKEMYFLMYNDGSASFTLRFFKESITFMKDYNCFVKSASYGVFNSFMIAASKISATVLNRKNGIFKTEKEAIEYLLQE